MMKTVPKTLLALAALLVISLATWFAFFLKPEIVPGAAEEKELLSLAASKDIVIIFNSGGWGNTPLEATTDFTPILAGIQDSLTQRGFSSVIIPFARTSGGLNGKIGDIKDYLVSFKYSSEALASEVGFIMDNFPGKQVVITGFSNGGGLTERAMRRLADRPGVSAIVAGVPHWYRIYNSNRILVLDNNGKDKLASGDLKAIAAAVIRAPFRWLNAKIHHRELNFARAIEFSGHDYPWSSAEVGPPVDSFLDASISFLPGR